MGLIVGLVIEAGVGGIERAEIFRLFELLGGEDQVGFTLPLILVFVFNAVESLVAEEMAHSLISFIEIVDMRNFPKPLKVRIGKAILGAEIIRMLFTFGIAEPVYGEHEAVKVTRVPRNPDRISKIQKAGVNTGIQLVIGPVSCLLPVLPVMVG